MSCVWHITWQWNPLGYLSRHINLCIMINQKFHNISVTILTCIMKWCETNLYWKGLVCMFSQLHVHVRRGSICDLHHKCTLPHLVLVVDICSFMYQQFSYSFVSILTCQNKSSSTIFLLLHELVVCDTSNDSETHLGTLADTSTCASWSIRNSTTSVWPFRLA